MIFTLSESARVMAGIQTRSTRRGRKRWELNGIHRVQAGRYGPTAGWIRIVGLSRICLEALTEEDAQAEGYRSLASRKRAWRELYGRWDNRLEVWDVRFVVTGKPERHQHQLTFFEEDKPHD